MKYLTVKQVLAIHARSIEQFGGDPTIRDPGLLDSAVAQPRSRFGGKNLYPDLAEKAVALAFSLVMNHPFADGNKRTGYGAMMRFLSRNDHTMTGSLAEHESTFLRLAAGELDRGDFLDWVRAQIIRK
jgi:death on curing protein